jgi:hypothetical protein
MRMRPGRSVTSMRPSGKKASDQGCTRPEATVSTLRLPANEGKICGAADVTPIDASSAATSRKINRIPALPSVLLQLCGIV